MNTLPSGTCLVGSELHGTCRGNRPRDTKRDFRLFHKYNSQKCVLEGHTNCEIISKVGLSNKDYLECLKIIRANSYQPQESIGFRMVGTEISCEFDRQKITSQNVIIFKSKIALAVLIKSFSRGGFYSAKNYAVIPQFKLKE